MSMRIVPPRNGWQWIVAGLRLFGRSPMAWMTIVLSYWLLMMLLNAVPWIGPIAGTVALPAFSVSFMAMARDVEAGRRLLPQHLFAGFARRRRELIVLGVIYLGSVIAVLLLSAIADGGLLARLMLLNETPAPEAIAGGGMARAGILALIVYTPVLMAYWFAPVLAAWEDMSAPKSLFFSLFAVWRNWRPFLVYGAGALLFAMPVVLLFGFAAAALAGLGAAAGLAEEKRQIVGTVLAVPILLGAASILIASFYAGYRDIFPPPPPQSAPEA